MDKNERVEVAIDIQDPESLPDSVMAALEQLATAIVEEEVTLTEEMQAALQESDDVAGFSFAKTAPLGKIPNGPGPTIGPTTMGWCIFKGSASEGNPCGWYSREKGEGPSSSCSFYTG